MCDKRPENIKADYDRAYPSDTRTGTDAVNRMTKETVIILLHAAARDLEEQAAGVRRLADIVNVAGEHEYPLFRTLIEVARK